MTCNTCLFYFLLPFVALPFHHFVQFIFWLCRDEVVAGAEPTNNDQLHVFYPVCNINLLVSSCWLKHFYHSCFHLMQIIEKPVEFSEWLTNIFKYCKPFFILFIMKAIFLIHLFFFNTKLMFVCPFWLTNFNFSMFNMSWNMYK